MERNKIPGYRQVNGSWGEFWWDGEKVFEIKKYELKATANRETVMQAGSLDEDSKITSVKVEGSFVVKHVFSRGVKKLLTAWKRGKDPRSRLVVKLDDPDAYGSERCVVNNVWFNDQTLMAFEAGKPEEREFSFGCTLSDIYFPDIIEVEE